MFLFQLPRAGASCARAQVEFGGFSLEKILRLWNFAAMITSRRPHYAVVPCRLEIDRNVLQELMERATGYRVELRFVDGQLRVAPHGPTEASAILVLARHVVTSELEALAQELEFLCPEPRRIEYPFEETTDRAGSSRVQTSGVSLLDGSPAGSSVDQRSGVSLLDGSPAGQRSGVSLLDAPPPPCQGSLVDTPDVNAEARIVPTGVLDAMVLARFYGSQDLLEFSRLSIVHNLCVDDDRCWVALSVCEVRRTFVLVLRGNGF